MTLTHRLFGVWVVLLAVLCGPALGQDFVDEEPVAPATDPDMIPIERQEDTFVTSPLTVPEGSDMEILWQLAGDGEQSGIVFSLATSQAGEVTDTGLVLEVRGLDDAGESMWDYAFDGEVTLPLWMGADADGLCTTLTFSVDPNMMMGPGGGEGVDPQVTRVVWDAAGGQVSDTTVTFEPELTAGNASPMMSVLTMASMSDTGDLFVTGMSMGMRFEGPPTTSAILGRLDASGEQIWALSWDATGSSEADMVYCLIPAVVATDDNELFAVRVNESFDMSQMWGGPPMAEDAVDWEGIMDTTTTLLKLSETGQELWSVEMVLEEEDIIFPNAVAVDEDGRAIVAGMTTGDLAEANAGGMDAFLAVYDEDGNWAWGHQIGGVGDDSFGKLVIDADAACVYAFGTIGAAGEESSKVVIACYDLLGGYLWEKTLDSADTVSLQDVQLAADGSLHLLCTQLSPDNQYGFMAAVGGLMGMEANIEGSGSVLLKLAPGWDDAP
jgi:hypothetical protein